MTIINDLLKVAMNLKALYKHSNEQFNGHVEAQIYMKLTGASKILFFLHRLAFPACWNEL